MKGKKITIENLAGMVERGFDDVEGRINKRFDRVDSEITGLKTDMSGLKSDVADLKGDVKQVSETTDKIYNLLDKNLKNQEEFKQEFKIVKYRQGKIEKVMKDKLGVEID